MKIERITLDGFKNLNHVNITFHKITALVALNNFGKSNVLSGIDFGLDFVKGNEEQKRILMATEDFIPINNLLVNRAFRLEIETTIRLDAIKYRAIYGFSFNWQREDTDDSEIISEYLKVKIDDRGQKYNQIINRNRKDAFYKSSETGRCNAQTKIGAKELVLNKLKAFDQLYYIGIIQKLNELRLSMENHLDAKNFYTPSQLNRKGLRDGIIDADNLPRVIAKLKQTDSAKFSLLLDAYKQLFPDIDDIIVKEFQINKEGDVVIPDDIPVIVSSSIYLLYVRDKNLSRLIDFKSMSDGAKKIFMILTKIIMASKENSNISLIAIEEPENSIHPSLFRVYLQIIGDLLNDCKVIMTSHSPYIISFLEFSSIYVGMHGKDGVAGFFGFKKNKERMLIDDAQSSNMMMGDYIFTLLANDESNIADYLKRGTDE